MPRSTLGGDDPDHQLSSDEKEERERELRAKAREALRQKRPKERRELENRAKNISKQEAGRADHH
jgi:hypothetical protein